MGTIKRENRVIITKKRIAGFDRSETGLLFLPLFNEKKIEKDSDDF